MRNLPQRAPTFQRFYAVYFQVWAMKPIAALLIVCLMVSAIPVLAMDCREWNSEKYFEAAISVEWEVAGCLQSGADPNVRSGIKSGGKTPWSYAKGRKQLKGSDAYRRLKEGRL